MRMAYNGSHAFLDVPALGRTVERGEPVEIDDETTRGRLSRQGWEYVRDEKTKTDDGKGND